MTVHLTIRGALGELKVRATNDLGRSRRVTLGVYVPKDASHLRHFQMKEAVARDVRRFAVMNAASSGTIAVEDVELQTLIRAELARECDFFIENIVTTDVQPKTRPTVRNTPRAKKSHERLTGGAR